MIVNHILIGAGRAGTTTVTDYLKQHQQINFSSIKEVTYFSENDKYERGTDFLHSFFNSQTKTIVATSDTYLLMSKVAPSRIFSYNPNMKLAVILRSPKSRTLSAYRYAINNGYVTAKNSLLDIQKIESKILETGDIIQQNNHAIFNGSLYFMHLSHWLKTFPKEQLFVGTTDQLASNPQLFLDEYCEFLEIEKMQIKQELKSNVSATVKNKQLNQVLLNRDHPLRRVVRPMLKMAIIKNTVIKTGIVDKLKSSNKQVSNDAKLLSKEETIFCESYFKEDLQKLKTEFGIEFSDDEYV